MKQARVKLVKEGASCDDRVAKSVAKLSGHLEPSKVKDKEIFWDNVQVAGNGEATVFDVCFCSGDKTCGQKTYIRLKGKLVAGEATASKCEVFGFEVQGFKQIPDLNPGNIKRCVYDSRVKNADRVEEHCRRVMAFFPPGYDMKHWGSDKSCAKHSQQITKLLKKR